MLHRYLVSFLCVGFSTVFENGGLVISKWRGQGVYYSKGRLVQKLRYKFSLITVNNNLPALLFVNFLKLTVSLLCI